jgi:hypothetical protein
MATWYLGPLGNLRELECPEVNMTITDVRYGGVHQGLSGARTMDVTGIKQDLNLTFEFLEEDDYRWLQALHTRQIPGPHRLINPLRKNRMTVPGAKCDATSSIRPGVRFSAGEWDWQNDWPTAAGYGWRSLRWFSRTASSIMVWDAEQHNPIFPLEQLTGSAYIKGDSSVTATFRLDYYDKDNVFLSSSTTENAAVTTSWARYSITRTAPVNACAARLVLSAVATTTMRVAAAQLEPGASATAWDQGGGSLLVLVDQMPTTSPRFPLVNCSISLLEA